MIVRMKKLILYIFLQCILNASAEGTCQTKIRDDFSSQMQFDIMCLNSNDRLLISVFLGRVYI